MRRITRNSLTLKGYKNMFRLGKDSIVTISPELYHEIVLFLRMFTNSVTDLLELSHRFSCCGGCLPSQADGELFVRAGNKAMFKLLRAPALERKRM